MDADRPPERPRKRPAGPADPATGEVPTPMTLDRAWPPLAIRIRTDRLVLRLPTDAEIPPLIDLAKAGIHPPDEMPFGSPWSTTPSPEFERGFVAHHWGARAGWSPDDWALHLSVYHDDVPIGSQSILATRFAVFRMVHSGSWLGQTYQGRGFGKEMRAAVLGFAFDGLGALSAETSAFLDNAASNGVTRSLGYEDNGVFQLAPNGVARDARRFRMTAEQWRSRPRPTVVVEGLDACRDMFGA